MDKLVYLLFEGADRPGSRLREALLGDAVVRLRGKGARRIGVDVDDEHVAAGKPIRRIDPPIRATVSFWLGTDGDREACEQTLAPLAARLVGYRVSETRPLIHAPPVGRRAPGMKQVTCIARKHGLDHDAFMGLWHGDHESVALETQSTVGYVRNVVLGAVTPDAPSWDGIVEEVFPIEALTDPRAFYAAGSDAELQRNAKRMLDSCRRFLEFESLECTPMSEYYLG